MTQSIYNLVMIRRYKHIGQTVSILTFKTRDEAQTYAAEKRAEKGEHEELSTAIIESMACYMGETLGMSLIPVEFSVHTTTNTSLTK